MIFTLIEMVISYRLFFLRSITQFFPQIYMNCFASLFVEQTGYLNSGKFMDNSSSKNSVFIFFVCRNSADIVSRIMAKKMIKSATVENLL